MNYNYRPVYPNELNCSLSHAWLKRGEMASKHKYIKRTGSPGHYRYTYPSEGMTEEDIIGLSLEEIQALDEKEYAAYEAMSYKEKQDYIEKLRERQTKYLQDHAGDHIRSDVKTSHKDGRYNLIDKAREQITGKLDADHVDTIKKNAVSRETDLLGLRSTNVFGEQLETEVTSKWIKNYVGNTVNTAYDSTLNARVKGFLNRFGIKV